MSYLCSCCGRIHDGLPDLAFDRPVYAFQVPESERVSRVRLDEDTCVIDDEDYFIRGVIEIPVRGQGDVFGIGAWVSQKRENFEAYVANFDTKDIGPFFGWLSNELRFGGVSSLNLKTSTEFLGNGLRPRFILEPTDHPFSRAQQDGLGLDAIWTLVHDQTGTG
jgi:hypothetical protein